MKTLLWKDYRLNRLLLIFGFVACVGPWIIAIAHNNYLLWWGREAYWAPEFWMTTSGVSLGLSLFTFAMFGGNAIAAERSDRSAEFLAYLPVSRWSVIASKSLIPFAAGAVIWAINLVILYIVAPRVGDIFSILETAPHIREMLAVFGALSILMFGSGWFWSTVLTSHGLATGMSFVMLAAVTMGFMGLEVACGFEAIIEKWFASVCFVIGMSGYVAGCTYYLRRLEP